MAPFTSFTIHNSQSSNHLMLYSTFSWKTVIKYSKYHHCHPRAEAESYGRYFA